MNDSRPRDEFGPLYCWCGARTSKRMVSRRMGRYCMKGHDTEHPPTPAPMTVGQLTAEHIGKRVRVGGTEFRPYEIEHYAAAMTTPGERVLSERRTRIEDGGRQVKWTYPTDTPCEVLDD